MNILNNTCYMIWICLTLHLIADYTLQGCLANLKQRDWWKEQIKQIYDKYHGYDKTYAWRENLNEKYRYDYVAGLLCHAAMWTLVTFFPLMFITDSSTFSLLAFVNIAIHTIIDHLKANAHKINLCEDQFFHLIEVIGTILIAQPFK